MYFSLFVYLQGSERVDTMTVTPLKNDFLSVKNDFLSVKNDFLSVKNDFLSVTSLANYDFLSVKNALEKPG
ncbi:hypothetical protein GCM10027511_18670 [Hymenobacter humi]